MSSPIEKKKAELRAMLVFDYKTTVQQAIKVACHEDDYINGARYEHAKAAPIAELLIEAIEVLEFYAKKDNWTTADEKTFSAIRESTFPKGDSDCTYEPANAGFKGGRRAREFLAKLSKGSGK